MTEKEATEVEETEVASEILVVTEKEALEVEANTAAVVVASNMTAKEMKNVTKRHSEQFPKTSSSSTNKNQVKGPIEEDPESSRSTESSQYTS